MNINNFLNYCNNMIVANEGEGFQKLKVWLITQFKKFLDWAEGAVKKMKSASKMKVKLLEIIMRAKSNLVKSKSLNERDKELADTLISEVELLDAEIETIRAEVKRNSPKSAQDIINEKRNNEYNRRYRDHEENMARAYQDLD